MISPMPGAIADQAGFGDAAASGIVPEVVDEQRRARCRKGRADCW